MKDANNELAGFTGTENYYRHHLQNVYFTDGIFAAAEKYECFWLIDLIFSWQLDDKVKAQPFQHWELKRIKNFKFVAMCSDGNDNVVAQQYISFSDFTCDIFKLYFENNVLMLPSER